jgi:hypothetical protein
METCTTDEQRRTEMLLEHKNAIVYGGASSSEPFHHESLFLCRSTIQSVPASNGCIIGLGEEHGWVVRMIRAGLRRSPFSTVERAED